MAGRVYTPIGDLFQAISFELEQALVPVRFGLGHRQLVVGGLNGAYDNSGGGKQAVDWRLLATIDYETPVCWRGVVPGNRYHDVIPIEATWSTEVLPYDFTPNGQR